MYLLFFFNSIIINIGDTMKKTLGIILKVFVITLVAAWMGLIITEFVRYKQNKPMLVVSSEKTLNYDDGNVTVYYGLGYKEIIYERTSLYGKEFGHIFIGVRDKVPQNK